MNLSDIKSRAGRKSAPAPTAPKQQEQPIQEVIQPKEIYQQPQQPKYQEPVHNSNYGQQPTYNHQPKQEVQGYAQHNQYQTSGYNYSGAQQAQQFRTQPEQYGNSLDQYGRPAHNTNNVASSVPATITPVQISTEMIARRLGLDPTHHIDVLKPTPLQVDPIIIREVRDVKGKIRAKVSNLAQMYRLPTVPFELGIMNNVIQIQEYEIVEIMGKKYASGIARAEEYSLLSEYVERIKQHLEDGEDFCEDLLIDLPLGDGTVIKTLGLNQYDLQLICGYFRNYNPMLISDGASFKICIGL